MVIERILALIKQKGITANQLQIACGLTNSNITAWKSGKAKPSTEALIKIADYFGVSVDYLLGKEKPEQKYVTTGISIARGGEIKTYQVSEERLKFLQDLAETWEKENKKK